LVKFKTLLSQNYKNCPNEVVEKVILQPELSFLPGILAEKKSEEKVLFLIAAQQQSHEGFINPQKSLFVVITGSQF